MCASTARSSSTSWATEAALSWMPASVFRTRPNQRTYWPCTSSQRSACTEGPHAGDHISAAALDGRGRNFLVGFPARQVVVGAHDRVALRVARSNRSRALDSAEDRFQGL